MKANISKIMDLIFNASGINESILTLTKSNEKSQYIDQVWAMMQVAYSKIGGFKTADTKDELIKKAALWKIVSRNGIVTAARLYKLEDGGRKSIAGAALPGPMSEEVVKDMTSKDESFMEFYNICVSNYMKLQCAEDNIIYSNGKFYNRRSEKIVSDTREEAMAKEKDRMIKADFMMLVKPDVIDTGRCTFGEVSGAMEHINRKLGGNFICNALIAKVLGKPIELIDPEKGNDYYHISDKEASVNPTIPDKHYARLLVGAEKELHRKIMVGNLPAGKLNKLTDDEFRAYCTDPDKLNSEVILQLSPEKLKILGFNSREDAIKYRNDRTRYERANRAPRVKR